jgi:hypothetical protein
MLEDNERQIEEDLTPFGMYDDGMPEEMNISVSSSEFDRILLN